MWVGMLKNDLLRAPVALSANDPARLSEFRREFETLITDYFPSGLPADASYQDLNGLQKVEILLLEVAAQEVQKQLPLGLCQRMRACVIVERQLAAHDWHIRRGESVGS